MPDWKQFVERKLGWLKLPRAERQEIIAELASHFEDGENHSSPETDDLCCSDWRKLSRAIQCAKREEGRMNHRTKSLWLPALATFLGVSLSLMSCQLLGMQPRILWLDKIAMWLYLPWLFTLPIFGALGAFLSQRAHGPTLARLAASLSPALIILIVMCLVLPLGLVLDGLHCLQLLGFGLGLINWVMIPGLALLLGAAPFLVKSGMGRA